VTARYIIADVFDGLRSLPDNSVDLVFTSPPFLALRSYLPADHPDKAREIGSEPTPAAFIDTLLDVTEELARVLAPHGSLCVELGDTYAGDRGGGTESTGQARRGENRAVTADGRTVAGLNQRVAMTREGDGWPTPKSLCLIPESYRLALTYGRNPFNGRETDPWRVRNVVRWHRPNPPVGALGDKFRPSTSDVAVACKSAKRYFDLDALRGPGSPNTHARTAVGVESRPSTGKTADDERRGGNFSTLDTLHDTNGAPPLDTWIIPTEPYKGSHYATFPSDLVVKPVAAMCPERVCVVCGAPSRRITEQSQELDPSRPQAKRAMELAEAHGLTEAHISAVYATGITDAGKAKVTMSGNGKNAPEVQRLAAEAKAALGGYFREFTMSNQVTLGWTDCGHDSWRRGVVLDPFAGSGTTLAVATGHGRDAIGIDIDSRNADLALERVGMFLTVDGPSALSDEGKPDV